MLEELNYQEMSEIKGGRMSYCDRLQQWANEHFQDATSDQWDVWADYWLENCSN